jgi:hypothetical protein
MINCPIINSDIDIGECVVIVDICEGCTKETMLPNNIKENEKDRVYQFYSSMDN